MIQLSTIMFGIYAVMRKKIRKKLKQELNALAKTIRSQLNLTKTKMAEKLFMNDRSYIDIESGVNMCGTLTTVLILAEMDDPKSYLEELKSKLHEASENADEEENKEKDIQLV